MRTPDAQRGNATRFPRLGLWLAAGAVFAGCSSSAPPAALTGDAWRRGRKAEVDFRAAMSRAAELEYAEAARKFAPLADEFEAVGNRARAAESAFWAGYCSEKLGDVEKAGTFYERAVKRYPRTPASRQAASRLERMSPTP